MNITETHRPTSREGWRTWLEEHHARKTEIWLLTDKASPALTYLEAVEEALCFGWIDGIAKRVDAHTGAQRFTPRRRKSHWTELNKERARRLIAQGRMTDAGRAVLPNLEITPLLLAPDLEAALRADPQTWQHFQAFPENYKRIRIGYIEEVRGNREVFASRLRNFVKQTRQNKQFGGTQ